MNYRAIIQTALDDLLLQNGQNFLKGNRIFFASDDDLSHEDWTIQESNILEDDLVDNFLRTNAEGRSWIHANLNQTDDKRFLITIRTGAKVGNPNPSVNVSFDKHLIRVIS
jgi:hypothetical protein